MKKKVTVLGCGMVGATMARDLADDESLDVTAVDVSPRNLEALRQVGGLKTAQRDLANPEEVKAAIAQADVVVGAMPSKLGFMILRTVIESGKPFADISFLIEDAMALNDLARQRGVTAVFDCGVAPGLANMIIGHCHKSLDQTDRVVYYVGGLPRHPSWPYLYKAPFAPSDVVEEYTRPVRMMENGRRVVKPALSEPERIKLPQAPELEAFNTDGLRSLLQTIAAPNMVEKTLRYPGHCELMAVLRETGFFAKEEIEVGGLKVRPLDVTSKLLFPLWTYQPAEEEFTVLRVIVEGRKDGRRLRHTYDLYDEYDAKTGQTSMARTTGFTCVIVARMLAWGDLNKPGVLAPEQLGMIPGALDHVTQALAARGVRMTGGVEKLGD